MDGFTNSKIEKQTIYEIYRACRLCGAGAGYKMPIIQNVVDLDSGDVDLKQKVRECVQIEVHQDDKMPPLICELCVDKVNDYYEFLEMCRQTNKRTRLRLGLPPQMLPKGAPDAGDCILGVTEPIFIDNDDDGPLNNSKSKNVKSVKIKRESDRQDSKKAPHKREINKEESKEKLESKSFQRNAPSPCVSPPDSPRLLRANRRSGEVLPLNRLRDGVIESRGLRKRPPPSRSPTPPRSLRGLKKPEDDVLLNRFQKSRKPEETTPKSILKKDTESKLEHNIRLKRSHQTEIEKLASCKKVKIMVSDFKTSPKALSRKPQPKSSLKVHRCTICKAACENSRSLIYHMRSHSTDKPAERPKSPPPKKELRKIECKNCFRTFIHKNLLDIHRCNGRTGKVRKVETLEEKQPASKPPVPKPPVPKLPVSKPPVSKKPAPRRLRVSTTREKTDAPIDPELLKHLQPLQVRIAKCDPLLENKIGDHYDVSDVDYDYGTDKTCVYPYIYTFRHRRMKSELRYMVQIQDEIKQAFDAEEAYVHWDSDETGSDLDICDTKKIDSLTSLSLKTIFSPKLIGKVPKKRKKVKIEKAFDSILNSSNDFDSDMRLGIDNIINRLKDDDGDKNKSALDDSKRKQDHDKDSLFGDADSPAITNDDFDSIFGSNDNDVSKSIVANKSMDATIADNRSEDSNATNFSMDFDDKVPQKDTNANDNIPLDTKSSSSVEKQDAIKNGSITINDCEKSSLLHDIENNKEISNDVKNVRVGETDKEKVEEDKKLYSNDNGEGTICDEEIIKNNQTHKANSTESNDVQTDNQDSVTNETHMNGQAATAGEFNMDDLEDVSDTEIKDRELIEELDNRIDESGTNNTKICATEKDRTIV